MMLDWIQHLLLLPILLPLVTGAVLITVHVKRHRFKFALNMISVLMQLLCTLLLMVLLEAGLWPDAIAVYLAGNWPAPFGIVLLADRLTLLMLLLTALLAACSLLYAMSRWSRIGVHFHSLFQFMMMGLNGAFLTHDLFNLFVFFEVMLAASYGLLLHGYNVTRLRAGMVFIAINLVASLLFLIGVATLYASAGTLNMSDLAARIPALSGDNLLLMKTGAGVLALAFLIKGAMWPLCFWLPNAYSAASPPVAAMMALMTKVGVYVILRLSLLLFSAQAGAAAGFGQTLLFWGGLATVCYGAIGMLGSSLPTRLAAYAAITSSGTLLTLLGVGSALTIPALLFYLLSSTLALAALLLLCELIERCRNPVEAMLAVTREAFDLSEVSDPNDTPEQPVGVPFPGGIVILGLAFAGLTLVIAGMPPLSGFLAKFAMFHALLDTGTELIATNVLALALVLLSGLAALIAFMRFGVRVFWASDAAPLRIHLSEALPVAFLLLGCLLITLFAGPLFSYMEAANAVLQQPDLYIERVAGQAVKGGG